MYSCCNCRKVLVRFDGGICYKCWHRINYARTKGQLDPDHQLDMFPDSAVQEREKPLT